MKTPRKVTLSLVLIGYCSGAWALLSQHHRRQRFTNHLLSPRGSFGLSPSPLYASSRDDDSKPPKGKKKISKKKTSLSKEEEKARKKEEIMKEIRSKLEEKKNKKSEGGLLEKFNPFQAGQNLRQTLGSLTKLGSGLNQETKQKYYLDDRFLESTGGALSERNPYFERQENTYVPEVLVIGATGEIGRLVVRRLLLEGRFRVRVLVRDLYSQTLNLLGTGVTYCQGDLGNMESLEYALTDVDKIVFCAGAPRPDEADFQEKFQYFLKENLNSKVEDIVDKKVEVSQNDMEWEQLSSILEVRAQLAEQVDCIGMQNLVRAYQNVRHADYGTSQAAKRSVFKFSTRPGDFGLFALDDDTVDFLASKTRNQADETKDISDTTVPLSVDYQGKDENGDNNDNDPYSEYDYSEYEEDDYLEDENYYDNVEARRDATVKSQIQWIRNEFGHGVFVGKVPKTDGVGVGGEAAIVSSRLRSREDPDSGIDLSAGFAGFIVRLVGDGSNYEVFVRTAAYEEDRIEYVCQFSTATKPTSRERKSRNKFITARLPFENFKPVVRKEKTKNSLFAESFRGSDVRYIGFRYRSGSNPKQNNLQEGDNVSFYIALSYMKVYRLQPEPEFVYLSDARIPPVVRNGMVRHDQRRLLLDSPTSAGEQSVDFLQLLDEKTLQGVERSPEETYYKFRGEEVLKSSGLSYTIIRVAGYNESPSGEASTIDLTSVSHPRPRVARKLNGRSPGDGKLTHSFSLLDGRIKTNEVFSPVSRAEAAQVCVSALLDSHALNKSVYIGKRKGSARDEDISAKFAALPSDAT